MKIVFLSIQSSDAKIMGETAKRMAAEENMDIDMFCINYEEVDDDPVLYRDLVRGTEGSDLVFVRCMADPNRFKRFEKYEKVLRGCGGYVFLYSGNHDVTFAYRDLFKGTDSDFIRLRNYAAYRGADNDRGILCWIANEIGVYSGEVPEPVKQRRDGIYHPDFDRDVTRDSYMRSFDHSRPNIGIMIPSNLWIYSNLDHIDALIRCIESKGMGTVPVFFSAASSSLDGEERTSDVIRKYMTEEGRPIVDAMIMCTSFSQLVSSRDTDGIKTRDDENYYRSMMNVPVIHAMSVTGEYADYETSSIGLKKNEISMHAAWPEVDGEILAVPICYTPIRSPGFKRAVPIPDRIEHISELAGNWAKLRRTPLSDRRIAILLYQSRPDSGNIGGAAGLDSLESVCEMLKRMDGMGYTVEGVPASGMELVDEILEGITNDLSWASPETVRERAADMMDIREYRTYFDSAPEFDRIKMVDSWGEPPGEICTDGGKMVVPGLIKGNVFIGYQPMRGWAEQMEAVYHDPLLFAQHQYLGFYRWIKNDFKADLVVHVGTHGTLEWLPGKNVGLSGKCDPDLILDSLPNVYPYIIDDPGEGIQTRRRSESVVIGHMNPTMARAGTYDELAEVEVPLQDYFKLRGISSEDRRDILVRDIYDAAEKHGLFADIGLEDPDIGDFEKHIVRLHEYITEVKDALVRSDLHVLGRPPSGDHFHEAVYSLTRLRNGDVPSLRSAYAENMGMDMASAEQDPSGISDGVLNSEMIDRVDSEVQELIRGMEASDYDPAKVLNGIRSRYGKVSQDLEVAVRFACRSVAPDLRRTTEEMSNMLDSFNGEYVLPGPSGAPTRGNAHILPMGRNYYSIDPDSVPNPSSWEIGRKMADQMIGRYVSEKGVYPEEVGFVIWATDTMKTGGDDVAYILWLMGVRPVWSRSGGQVIDLEVVPLSELGRPRIDVTVNITGLFRDAFPNIIDMIDDAASLVSDLDESDEDNRLAANMRRDIVEGMAEGLSHDEARRLSAVRIFGAPPGGYGTGINHAIETGGWDSVNDLADIYIAWCGHGYSRGDHGADMKDRFIKRFGRVGITVKNMPDREIDLLDCDDVYSYLGAMNAFVRAYGRKDALSVMGDGSDPDRVRIRDTETELRYVFRSKVLNPKFMDGLKEHGYRGAAELANITEYTFAWDATSDIVDDWMYGQMAEKFLFDEETREWMLDVNPHAMMNIMDRLQEAIRRGMWDATDDMKDRLKDLYMGIEERIEEITDR